MSDANPFDAFDQDLQLPRNDTLEAGPRPSLVDRFRANVAAGFSNTTTGAAIDATTPGEPSSAERRKAAWEALPQWEGTLEGAVSLGGQLVGSAPAIENFLPLGLGARFAGTLGLRATGVGARVLAGATDAAVINAGVDPIVQGLQIAGGGRETYDPWQTATGAALGGAIGGAAPLAAAGARRLFGFGIDEAVAEAGKPRPETGRAAKAAPDGGPATRVAPAAAAEPSVTEPPTAAMPSPATAPTTAEPVEKIDMASPGRSEPPPVVETPRPASDGAPPVAAATEAASAKEPSLPPATPERPDQVRAAAEDAVGPDATLGDKLAAEAAIREGRPVPPVDVEPPPIDVKPKRRVTRQALSLAEFIASNGGLRDEGGEVSAAGGTSLFVPGFGRIMRQKGRSLDNMREIAAEAGYFDDRYGNRADAVAQSTPSDLIDALRTDMAALGSGDRPGRVWSSFDADFVQKLHDEAARHRDAAEMEQWRQRLVDEGVVGVDDVFAERALAHYHETGDFDTALERAAIELEDRLPPPTETTFDYPGWETTNVEPGGAQGRGAEVSRLGEQGARSADAGGVRDGGPTPRSAGGTVGATERTAVGDQGLIPGVAPVSDKTRAEAAAKKPLKGGDRALPDGGLFDETARNQKELFLRTGSLSGETKRFPGGVAEVSPDTNPPLVRLRDAADALIEALDPAAVRQGRLPSIAGVQGVYKPKPGVVRVRNSQDFSVLSHELGHHLEVALGKPGAAWIAAHSTELSPLAYVGTKKGAEVPEGFAEMARLFVTNRPYLDATAPGLAAAFEAELTKTAPDLLAALGAARDAWTEWTRQPSQRAVRSTIVAAKRPGWIEKGREALGDVKGTIAEFFSTGYTRLMDDLHPIQVTVRELTRLWAEKHPGQVLDLKATDDAYKLARMARGGYSAGHADILFGVTPYHGTSPVSGSLRDALIEAQGGGNLFSRVKDETLADFGAYLWSRRAVGEWDRYGRGEIPNPPDKLTLGDHRVNIAEMEAKHPSFAAAAEKVYDWNRALWDKKLDAGLITGSQHADGLKIVDYVPGLRHFDEAEAKMPARGAGRTGKGAMVRRFEGSDRDVVNPIDSLVADAYETAMTIARNDTVKALARLGDLAGNGAGRFVERIPRTQATAVVADTDQILEQMARELGLSRRDAQTIRDAIVDLAPGADLPEQLKTFKQALTTERGEAIVWYREGGELVPLRLADGKFGREMVGALNVMTRDEKTFLLDVLAKPGAVLRLGITTHPTFLVANFVRDQMVTAILFGKPFQRVGLSLRGFADDLLGAEAAKSYIRAGGISGGASSALLSEARVGRDTGAATLSGVRYRFGTFKGLIEATESAETASRLGNFGVFFKEARARGLSDWEASFEAAYRARDVLDFDRRGSATMAISRIIPFLNASVQGLDKAARELVVPMAKRLSGNLLTAEEERQLANSTKAWGRLAAATVGTLGLWALVSRHPDADEIDPRVRATHWVIPHPGGDWIAVPKPFELAAILNLGEFAWDAWAKRDPTAAERYLSGLYDVLSPPSLLEGNPLLKTAYEAKANIDFFTGRPIVPDEMAALEPWLQYNSRTSTLAKTLGEAANVSPLKIDHVITGFGGSWGRSLLSLSDWASNEKPATGWAEALFTRRFIKDASRGSTSVSAFWDLVSQRTGSLEGALKSYRAMVDAGRLSEASDFAGRMDDDTRVYLAATLIPGKRGQAPAKLHPLVRARSAVQAIGGLMRDLSDDKVETADGVVHVPATDRRRALDVLSDLRMAEARNAMIQVGARGFAAVRAPIPTDGYLEELVAISPEIEQALADRYRTARVLKQSAVDAAWPEFRSRILADGTEASVRDLAAAAYAEGFELEGRRIRPKGKPALPGNPGD